VEKVLTIVGQGLSGTLAALEAQRRGYRFVVVDQGSGATASRVAAGLFNPLTGPRFTADTNGWDRIVPVYREIEALWDVRVLHLLPVFRPWDGALKRSLTTRSAPGWSAREDGAGVWIKGGGWVDLPALLDAARSQWKRQGKLEERTYSPDEGRGRSVWWCGGLADLTGPVWGNVTGVANRWQGVRGDLLTVRIPDLQMTHVEIGTRFFLPLGDGLFRWGATHESDVLDQGPRPAAGKMLEDELAQRPEVGTFEVVAHQGGVRPASRTGTPLVLRHPEEPSWTLFNGFGGRGVSLIPRWLDRLNP